MLTGYTFSGSFTHEGMLGEIPVSFQLVLAPDADLRHLDDAAQALGMFLAHERMKRFEESGGGGMDN